MPEKEGGSHIRRSPNRAARGVACSRRWEDPAAWAARAQAADQEHLRPEWVAQSMDRLRALPAFGAAPGTTSITGPTAEAIAAGRVPLPTEEQPQHLQGISYILGNLLRQRSGADRFLGPDSM